MHPTLRRSRPAVFVALLGGLLGAVDQAEAIPTVTKSYAFDFTSINLGTGSFTITAEDTANPVTHTALNSPISNFTWSVPSLFVTFGQADLTSFFTNSWADSTPFVLETFFFSARSLGGVLIENAFVNQTAALTTYDAFACKRVVNASADSCFDLQSIRSNETTDILTPLPESVPEPAELALLGLGLLALNQLRRRAERRQT